MKRFLNTLFWLAVVAYYFVALSFVSLRQSEAICTSVVVDILDGADVRFVTAADIRGYVDNSRHKIRGMPMDSISTSAVEAQLQRVSAVEHADAYKTSDGALHIDIRQRVPLLRIINRFGESYYIDSKGYLLRHVNRYSVRVLVANGHINMRMPDRRLFNVADLRDADGNSNIVADLYRMAVWIDSHRFWKAQIQQMYVNAEGDIELIPLVGSHTIVFGRAERIDEKFAMLNSLYRKGLNVKGWNSYSLINLKYRGQIVCTRRE